MELAANSVKGHMLLHTGDKPHACQLCGQSFRRTDHLRTHCVRVHAVELPSRRQKVERVSLDTGCLLAATDEDTEAANAMIVVAGESTVVAQW